MKGEKTKKLPDAIAFDGQFDLPHAPVSMGTTQWHETGTWRYLRPQFVEGFPSCQNSCPTASDIESWIAHLENGETEKAWEAATLENPFPSITGRACFQPCVDACNRKELGGAVNIRALERALGDAVSVPPPPAKPLLPPSGKRIAIVGSGPAGLACAYHLRRFGHDVTVFEKEKRAGGILRYGIPRYRLPTEVIDGEIEMLQAMGIAFELGKAIPDATHLQTLRQDYDALFIASGAHKPKKLNIEGENAKGVMTGQEFLHDVSIDRKPDIGKTVVVIGGGNTAVDAARSALSLGSSVTILYRRSRPEMPAFEREVTEAEAEGVKLNTLMMPTEIVSGGSGVRKIKCVKMELGDPDESGRRRPVPLDGSDTSVECDTVIVAIGEEIDTSIIPSALHIDRGAIRTGPGGRTEWHGVFAGGDFTQTRRTIVDALASGKTSAIAIDCDLLGENIETVLKKCSIGGNGPVLASRYAEMRGNGTLRHSETTELSLQDIVVDFERINCVYFTRSEPETIPETPPSERVSIDPFAEIEGRLSDDAMKNELARCFHCGRCTVCDNCYIYCPDVAISKVGAGFEIDMNYCKGCGVCTQECPRAAMEMIEEPTE